MIEKIKQIIEGEINDSLVDEEDGTVLIDWDSITEQAHEVVYKYLTEQITDLEDYAWLYDISELVAFNEACRIIKEIRESKWCDDVISDTLGNAYDAHLLQKDSLAYYGVSKSNFYGV